MMPAGVLPRPIVLLTTLVLTVGGAVSAQNADEQAIRALVERYTEARARSDAAALASMFTADADQLTSSGEWRKGRDAVVKGSLASSEQNPGRRTMTLDAVRFPASDVALTDIRYEIAQADGGVRRMWAAWIVVRTGDGWKIAGIRNMLPAAP
jgi:uncharacterized protein (TIGR02246 family)